MEQEEFENLSIGIDKDHKMSAIMSCISQIDPILGQKCDKLCQELIPMIQSGGDSIQYIMSRSERMSKETQYIVMFLFGLANYFVLDANKNDGKNDENAVKNDEFRHF